MNSFMNKWIHQSYFMGEIMVSYKKHSAASQYESASTAAAFARLVE